MLSHPRRTPRGSGAAPHAADALQHALPSSERQRVARALRVAAPRTVALLVLVSVRSLECASRAHAQLLTRPTQLLCFGVAASRLARLHGPALWSGMEVARRNVYCEARPALAARCAARQLTSFAPQEVRWDQATRQPVNTVSNLPFALTGAHMLALGVADARAWWRSSARMTSTLVHSELQRYPLFSLANGGAQLWVAAGSLLFHASYTRAGQRADMGAVYTVLLCPLVYLAQRLGLLGPGDAHVPFVAALLGAGAWFTHNKWRLKSMRVVPALLVLLVLLKALWLTAGSGEREAGLRRWLWGPQRRDRPAGLAWPLLSAALLCIVLAFGACPSQLESAADCALIASRTLSQAAPRVT